MGAALLRWDRIFSHLLDEFINHFKSWEIRQKWIFFLAEKVNKNLIEWNVLEKFHSNYSRTKKAVNFSNWNSHAIPIFVPFSDHIKMHNNFFCVFLLHFNCSEFVDLLKGKKRRTSHRKRTAGILCACSLYIESSVTSHYHFHRNNYTLKIHPSVLKENHFFSSFSVLSKIKKAKIVPRGFCVDFFGSSF